MYTTQLNIFNLTWIPSGFVNNPNLELGHWSLITYAEQMVLSFLHRSNSVLFLNIHMIPISFIQLISPASLKPSEIIKGESGDWWLKLSSCELGWSHGQPSNAFVSILIEMGLYNLKNLLFLVVSHLSYQFLPKIDHMEVPP